MISFTDFVHKYKLKNKATSNKKNCQVLSFLSLNDVGIYLGDSSFPTGIGIVNLYPSKDTH